MLIRVTFCFNIMYLYRQGKNDVGHFGTEGIKIA